MDNQQFENYTQELESGEYNCIVVKDDKTMRFKAPGVKTLLTLLNEDPGFLEDSIVFDSIVGKGAAALMILGKVKEIYAGIISEHAISLLDEYKMKYSYNTKVPFIENRLKTGLCPIENISVKCSTPQEVKSGIIEFISLQQRS